MKLSLLSVLRCPDCESQLQLRVLQQREKLSDSKRSPARFRVTHCAHRDSGECDDCARVDVQEGLLTCASCSAVFPIVNSVPRFLPGAIKTFPEIQERWASQLNSGNNSGSEPIQGREGLDSEYRQVVRHFQTQWKYWGRHSKNFGRDIQQSLEFLQWTLAPKASPDFFDRKLILDAGCGHGKYLAALSAENVEVIGMDITRSIDLCQELVGDRENVHLVQGDVIHPPFAKGIFDYVYSNGVIHHTPDTRRAFRSLAALPKTGATYAIWVYPYRAKWWDFTQQTIRGVTTKLPPGLLRALCYIPVPLLSIPGIGAYSDTSLKTASWGECAQVIFDFYGPKYQTHHTPEEIARWFQEEGYGGVTFGPDPLSAIGVRA
jgi:SAM-dependent methyltransferase/uncharacterized protein YbaR (Trm112 family)